MAREVGVRLHLAHVVSLVGILGIFAELRETNVSTIKSAQIMDIAPTTRTSPFGNAVTLNV